MPVTKQVVEGLFPFHFAFDQELRIQSLGRGLQKLEPTLEPGASFLEYFRLERPHLDLDFDLIQANQHFIFVFEPTSARYRLRGQIFPHDSAHLMYFLGSPWVEDMEALQQLGLSLRDFPLHDSSPDVLQVLQAQRTMVSDLKTLNDKLSRQRADLRAANNLLVSKQREVHRLAMVASKTEVPVLITDAEDRIEWVNDAFIRFSGYTQQEVLGRSAGSILTGPETNLETLAFIAECCRELRAFSCEILNYTKSGSSYWAAIEVSPIQDENGNPAGFITIQQDITKRRRMAEYNSLEIAVTRLLAQRLESSAIVSEILSTVCSLLGFCAGLLWRIASDGSHLLCGETWSVPQLEQSPFMERSKAMTFTPGLGLPGTVWIEAKPKWMFDLSRETYFPRLPSAAASGVRSGFAFPIQVTGSVLGVMEFFDFQTREPNPQLLEVLARIGVQLGQFLERAAAEAKQANLLSVLQATFDATADGILLSALDQSIVSFNQRFLDLWQLPQGTSKEASITQLRTLVHDQLSDPEAFFSLVQQLYANPEEVSAEVIHFKDGRVFERFSQPQRLADRIIGRIWSYRDVTEQWRSQQALRESEERYRIVAETASYGILTVDEGDTVVYANAAAGRILGYPRNSLLGLPLDDLIPGGVSHSICSLQSFESTAFHKNENPIPVELSVGEYQIAGQNLVSLIFQDVTPRKVYERKIEDARELAEASNRAKSAFVANMSHELRTPLNAILGYTEMVIEDATENGHSLYTRDLARVLTAGRHLLTLIDDILDISKIEAGKMEVHPEWVDVESIINECVSTLAPIAQKNNNQIIVKPWEPVGQFWTDPTRFRQSLFNLLSNASKFRHDGLVELSLQLDQQNGREWTHWSVRDTGRGISKEDQSKLFTAFTQVNWSTSKSEGGTGLGLAITRSLCEAMGGHVSLESEPGVGSCFTISLPRRKPEGS